MTRKELDYEIAKTLYRYSCLDVGNFQTYTDCINETAKLIECYMDAQHLTILDTDYLQSFIDEHMVK